MARGGPAMAEMSIAADSAAGLFAPVAIDRALPMPSL
jgi:hypothetical protein